jgi:predicted dehydrogenase
LKKIRWGFLGTARINDRVLPHLRSSDRSAAAAVASRDGTKAAAYAKAREIPLSFGSYTDLVESSEVDVIYIGLPNHLHFEWTKRALENDKHVLCEKPFVLSGQEAAMLAKLAENRGLILAEGFSYRHHAQTRRVLELLEPTSSSNAGLGKIRRVHATFHTIPEPGPNVRTSSDPGAGALYDVGCYLVDYCLALMGCAPEKVFAIARFSPAGYDEFFSGTLVFGDDCVAQIDCGFLGPRVDRIEVLCENGWLRIAQPFKPGSAETLSIHRRKTRDDAETTESILVTDARDPFLAEIRDFESAIFEKRSPLVSPLESVATAATLECLFTSARTGEPRKLELA